MSQPQSHAHHYVPQWYQRRFIPPGQSDYFLLDLHPKITEHNGFVRKHRELFSSVPKRCFYKDDLYTLSFGKQTTDSMERLFFGEVDSRGHEAVTTFSEFKGIDKGGMDAFQNVVPYMGAQRFRTPRGLDEIRKRAAWHDGKHQNATLVALTGAFQAYTTMWIEGVWEVVRAHQSPTKFIVSDDPVTFYCKVMFPSEWTYPDDCSLKQIGTRTIFPLGLDSCLIITHLQLARWPFNNPTEPRANARFYDQTTKHLGEIQFGRELEEDEVLRINYILKKRATRYIAAANKDWLFPEQHVSTTDWKLLDDDWFLFPHLWKVSFTSEIIMGGDGWSWAMDEYGRHPGDPEYRNQKMHEEDWVKHDVSKREWAKKRAGKSLAQNDKFEHGHVHDKMMQEFLEAEGCASKSRLAERRPRVDLEGEIRRAQELGQKLEDLVVNAGQVVIKTEGSQLLIGFWSLIFDSQKGMTNRLLWKFYAAAFALWRPIVEAESQNCGVFERFSEELSLVSLQPR